MIKTMVLVIGLALVAQWFVYNRKHRNDGGGSDGCLSIVCVRIAAAGVGAVMTFGGALALLLG